MSTDKKKEEVPKPETEDLTVKDETKNKDKKKANEEEESSEEDQKLKGDSEMLVQTLSEDDSKLYETTLTQLKEFIKNSTSSMTAVPKPLKFLRPFYPDLCKAYDKWSDKDQKSSLADMLSVLAMTYSDTHQHDSLRFRLLSDTSNIASWGHEYVRHSALEIGEVYNEQVEKEAEDNSTSTESSPQPPHMNFEFSKDVILQLSLEIVPYFMKHNGEEDAVDLLLEIEAIEKLPQFVDENTYKRVCQYMIACVQLLPPPEDISFLQTAYSIYLSELQLPEALSSAIRLGNEDMIRSVFDATSDPIVHQQLAYILAAQRVPFEHPELQEIIGNTKSSEHFLYLAKELNLLTPKIPEDIYKSHLDSSKSVFSSAGSDSAQQNLAASFVNAFLNLGYCNDKMITDNDNWVYKTKGDGMTSAVASIGSIYQWNIDGLQQLDKYLYVDEPEVKAGGLLGIGIASAGVHHDVEPALLLLQEYINHSDTKISTAAILGIGIAFAGSKNDEVLGLSLPVVSNTENSLELAAIAALALSHVFVGTCNGDITTAVMDNFLERTPLELKSEWARFLALSSGLLYLGQGEHVDDVLETINAIEHPMTSAIEVLISSCAYTATGDVLLVQDLSHRLTPKAVKSSDEDEDEDNEELSQEDMNGISAFLGKKENEIAEEPQGNEGADNEMEVDSHQDETTTGENNVKKEENEEEKTEKSEKTENDEEEEDEEESKDEGANDELAYAVIGIALITMGEEIGKEMSLRHFGHLMHYGNEHIRRMVPLAMGLVSVADPQMKVFDTLTRFSHDPDLDVSMNSIFAMGLCGVGTNNARLAQLLRQLASYYSREQDALFITRLAQGLVHLGKGTMTMDIFNDAHVLNKVTLASLLTVLVGLISPSFILKHHQLFYMLNSGVRPKFIITLNEEGEQIKVNVRIGQAVETVGQAGKPKTITGWITQSTPVLLGHGERAELENDEYISYTNNIEGVVILKKNPNFQEEE